MLVDQFEREQALDVSRSFCVSAPAGSGKTELLTQRYLGLLLTVDDPEQVLAVTFTRKARAEMTERIMKALKLGMGPKPEKPYLQTTWAAAKAVLEQDALKGWNLSRNPTRLRVQTIDSLNQAIAGESPLLNGFGSAPAAVDDANSLYLQTIPRLLNGLDDVESDLAHALQQVLLVFNGDTDRFADLLCKLLAKRDQWLQYVGVADNKALLFELLNKGFTAWLEADMHNALALLQDFEADIVDSLSFAMKHGANPDLAVIEQACGLPEAELSNVAAWQALADWLLTSGGSVRKSVTVKQGFPAKSAAKDSDTKALYEHEKQRMLLLLQRLKDNPETLNALQTLRLLPKELSEAQLQTAKNILLVLKYAVANLSLVFAETGQCDHIQIALTAANLLGDDETPSATQLRWNQRLRHILIDEFQDTSFIQHTILQRLVALWPEAREHEPEQLRSLFVVGDGMQSIYRFRAANVGLFLQAKHSGIGLEPLEALNLQQNFRSEKPLVDWFNTHFEASFPSVSDAATGAVPYSIAYANGEGDASVSLEGFANPADEASYIAGQAKQLLADKPTASIAILVRARNHLTPIMEALLELGVDYQSNDIKHLNSIPEVIDIINLTKFIIDASDNISFAAVLRAPWCGASLNELYLLAEGLPQSGLNFANILQNFEHTPERLQPTLSILIEAWQQRDRKPLADTVMGVWQALGGQYCVGVNRPYIDQYIQCLRLSDNIDCADTLDTTLKTQFVKPVSNNARVSVMTIHKSKGLEFDTVFLPSLAKTPMADSANLLEYAERLHNEQQHSFLLAPWGKSAADQQLRAYVKNLDKQASRHEMLRVLYVAATRASSRLVMSFVYKLDEKAGEGEIKLPAKNSLLNYIWPSVSGDCRIHKGDEQDAVKEQSLSVAKRLAKPPASLAKFDRDSSIEPSTNSNQDTAETALGTLLHQLLEQIALNQGRASTHLRNYSASQIDYSAHIQNKDEAKAAVTKLIENVTQTELGKWVITAGEQAQNEWAITTVNIDKSVSRYVIDRSFVENETRWIIDYKASTPKEGQSLSEFLDQQATAYRRQLAQYEYAVANLRVHKLSRNSIKTALYFPLINEFHEVQTH